MKNLLACLMVVAACGGDGSDTPSIDAAPVAGTVMLSGTAKSRGLGAPANEAGVTIAAYAVANETTPLAMTTTDASGNFTLAITTNGAAIDGYLQATKGGFITSYLYTPTPIGADLAMIPMNMVASNLWDTLSTLASAGQTPTNGVAAMIVVSGSELTSPVVAGATITTTPTATYRYSGTSGLPSNGPTVTGDDGIGYAFNAPPGTMTATASKSGATFKTTTFKVRAMSLTQTLIIQ